MMIFHRLILITLLSALSSCGLSPAKAPEEHFYRLPDNTQIKLITAVFKNLALAPVSSNGIYNERAILYRKLAQPLEIHRYHYHFWSQTPAKLVQDYMQQYLQQSNIASQITLQSSTYSNKNVMHTELVRFERVVDGKQTQVEVALKVTFADRSKTYQVQQKAGTADMHNTVAAFGLALSKIMSQLTDDLQQHKK